MLLHKLTKGMIEDAQIEIPARNYCVNKSVPATLPLAERVEEVLSKLHLNEKLNLLSGKNGFSVPGIPRLGIPAIWMSDATSGIRGHGNSTAFPSAIAMAASWNRDLMYEAAQALAEECRTKGISVLLGPGVNIARVPTCGRNFEYMGEDPFLAGEIATAYIRGLQSKNIAATIKHFVANNSDYDRHRESSNINETVMHELYLPAFRKAIKEADVKVVMTAYNPVNGIWMSEHSLLVRKVLKENWRFQGVVVSDWISTYSTKAAIKAGLDIEMPAAKWFTAAKLKRSLDSDEISIPDIDEKVRALLSLGFWTGAYDNIRHSEHNSSGIAENKEKTNASIQEKSGKLAENMAAESVVLLKNHDLLPLQREKIKNIVLIGRATVHTDTGGGGSSYVKKQTEDILTGVKKAVDQNSCRVEYLDTKKPPFTHTEKTKIESADVIICATGFDHILESEFYDRSWSLPGHEAELISAAGALNKNMVVVMTAGGDLNTGPWLHAVKAVIHSFYLGQSVGKVIADIIFGEINPSGKLPFTMAKQWNDIASVAHYHRKPDKISFLRFFGPQGVRGLRKIRAVNYQEGLAVGYRHFDMNSIMPQFPFGYGLSYTEFSYDRASLTKKRVHTAQLPNLPQGSLLTAEVQVSNSGDIPGSEVVQVYVSYPVPPADFPYIRRPPKALHGFAKAFIQPGESKTVKIPIENAAFYLYNEKDSQWYTIPGTYRIMIGSDSYDIRLTTIVELV